MVKSITPIRDREARKLRGDFIPPQTHDVALGRIGGVRTDRPIGQRDPLASWHLLALELTPDVELDPETFAAIWTTYRTVERAGHPIDPVLKALLTLLAAQAFATDDGGEDAEDELDRDPTRISSLDLMRMGGAA